MVSVSLRPVWFLLAGIVWGFLAYLATPTLDGWATSMIGENTGDLVVSIFGYLPWFLWGLGFVVACLVLVWMNPAWKGWLHSMLTALIGAVCLLVPYWFVYNAELIDRDVEPGFMFPVTIGFSILPYVVLSILNGLLSATRVWSTPEPLHEDRFGPRTNS